MTIARRAVLLGLAASSLGAGAAIAQDAKGGGMTPAGDLEWDYLADTVMGGVSQGRAWMEDGVLRLAGTVSTKNRGGFIQARTPMPDGLPEGTTALRLRVRGNGERYFVHLRTTRTILPWQYYQAGFDTGADWAEVTVPLRDFKPSGRLLPAKVAPGSVRSIGLVAYGRDHEADVSLAAIGTV